MHETRYETIIPHLAWFAEKKFPYNPVSIIFATYSTRMEWIGLVVAVESNDKRPNILLDEEDTRTFFSPRIFLFVRPHRCLFFIPLFRIFFSPSLFFFSLFFREERERDGDGTIQFRMKKKRNDGTCEWSCARWRKQLPIFMPLAPVRRCYHDFRTRQEVEAGQFTSTTHPYPANNSVDAFKKIYGVYFARSFQVFFVLD